MRPIDAVSLSEGVDLHRQSTDQECEMDRQWAVGYNAGLDRALYSIAYAKTITPPPNDPLTLEQLREMDGEPVWNDTMKKWVLVDLTWEYGERTVDADGKWRDLGDRYYRRRPEEGTT